MLARFPIGRSPIQNNRDPSPGTFEIEDSDGSFGHTTEVSDSSFRSSLQDSFDPTPPKRTCSQKLIQVCDSKKNTAGNAAAMLTSSGPTVVRHVTQVVARHSAQVIATTSAIAPLGTGLGTGLSLLKDAHTQNIVELRLSNASELLKTLASKYFPQGLPELDFEVELKNLHDNPADHDKQTLEVMLHTIGFSIYKMKRRLDGLKLQQCGSGIVLTGVAMTAGGSLIAGVGALPGTVVMGVGGAVNLAPSARAVGRAAKKKMDGSKGVLRESCAQFVWGFALRKLIRDKILSPHLLRESTEANLAFILAEQWPYLRAKEDVSMAQEVAYEFLKQIGIIKNNVIPENFATVQCFEKIFNRFKSTANV